MLSVYSKWKGSTYLRATLQKVLERLMLTSKDLDLELDPARVNTTEELQKNALQLRIVAKVFIDDICASSSNIPASFRKICNIVCTCKPKHPGSTAYGQSRYPMPWFPGFQTPSTLLLVHSSSFDSFVPRSSRPRLRGSYLRPRPKKCAVACFSSQKSFKTSPITFYLVLKSRICSHSTTS